MSYEHEYRELQSGRWALVNPSTCPCRGHGWLLSDLDTFHRCPMHGSGVPHPESDDEAFEGFDMQGHLLRAYRAAWESFRHRAELPERVFRSRAITLAGSVPTSPEAWVNAAQAVLEDVLDERARAAGFSCRLEAAWSRSEAPDEWDAAV